MTIAQVDPSREKAKQLFLKELNDYRIGPVDQAELKKPQTWVLQGDGLYLFHKNKIGIFATRKMDFNIPGLEISLTNKNSFRSFLPKIPKKFYDYVLNFFKDVNTKLGVAEAFVQFYYDSKENKYVPHVPLQKVAPASVHYDATQNLNNLQPKRYTFVFEIHSHGNMSAFFSGTDNADEKDTRFFGVMGNVNQLEITERYRYLICGEEVAVLKEHIFDLEEADIIPANKFADAIKTKGHVSLKEVQEWVKEQKETSYPAEWMTKIQKAPGMPETENIPSSFHSKITPNGIKYQKPDLKKYEDREYEYAFSDTPKKRKGKFIGSIPAHLYAESTDVIYDMGEFGADEVEEIFDKIVASSGAIEVQLLIEKLCEHGFQDLMLDVGAMYEH